MRKSYGCEHFKIPSVLEDPYDNKQQKVSNMVFSFPYRDKHFAQKGQLPYQPSVCTKLQHMLISQIWQWRKEMHDAALSISGCCRGRKGQSLYNPKSSHTMREHQWVALLPFGYEVFGANSETFVECSISLKPQGLSCVLLRSGGGWPHSLCLWGNWAVLSTHTQGLRGHRTELSNLFHHLHSGKAFSDL